MMNPKGSCKAAFLVQINNIEFLTLTNKACILMEIRQNY